MSTNETIEVPQTITSMIGEEVPSSSLQISAETLKALEGFKIPEAIQSYRKVSGIEVSGREAPGRESPEAREKEFADARTGGEEFCEVSTSNEVSKTLQFIESLRKIKALYYRIKIRAMRLIEAIYGADELF